MGIEHGGLQNAVAGHGRVSSEDVFHSIGYVVKGEHQWVDKVIHGKKESFDHVVREGVED